MKQLFATFKSYIKVAQIIYLGHLGIDLIFSL